MAEIPVTSTGGGNIPLIPETVVPVPSSMQNDTVISHFVIWISLSPLGYYNGSQRIQIK